MFARQAGYLALVREHGFPLPTATTTSRRSGSAYAARSPYAARRDGPVQQRPARRQLHRRRPRIWLIDYEYSGNNDPAFELGNTATECDLTREQIDELVDAWAGAAGRGLPGPGRAPVAVLGVRLVAVGLHPGRHQSDFDFHGLGDGALREGRRRFTSDGFDACCRWNRWLRCEER